MMNPTSSLAGGEPRESSTVLPMSREALEALPFPIAIYAVDGRCIGANTLVERLFGVSGATLPRAFDLLIELGAPEHEAHELFRAALAGQQVRTSTLFYQRPFPGSRDPSRPLCWLEATLTPVRDGAGAVTCIGSIFQDVTDRILAKQRQQELEVFQSLVDHAPDAIGISGIDGRITYANPAYRTMYGYGEATIGMDWRSFYPPHTLAQMETAVRQVLEQGFWRGTVDQQRKDGHIFPVQVAAFLLRDPHGNPYAFTALIRDLSEEQRREQERRALQEQIIEAQQAALRQLSTPLIPIADDVVAMPLIGTIDSSRAQMVMETLLNGIVERRAQTAIIDITGVSVVDTEVANSLIRAARAARLLGVQVILTGIHPEVAQALVTLGVDLSGIITRSTLQSGIAEALRQGPRSVPEANHRSSV